MRPPVRLLALLLGAACAPAAPPPEAPAPVAGRLWLAPRLYAVVGARNTPPRGDTLTLYDRAVGRATPAGAGVVEVAVRPLAPAGDTARGVVLAVDTLPAGVAVPAEGAVFAARGRAGAFLRLYAAPGDTVRWIVRPMEVRE